MEFEWDERKAASNLQKHGLSFGLATRVFDDPDRVEYPDDEEHDEDRWLSVGIVGGTEIAVVYTVRGENTRLISARRAARHERDRYWRDR